MQSAWDASTKGCECILICYRRPSDYSSFQLLEREPSKRLACKPRAEGFEELQQHPWFRSIDWVSLENKEEIPPFVPDVSTLAIELSRFPEELCYSPRKPTSMHHTSLKSYYWRTTRWRRSNGKRIRIIWVLRWGKWKNSEFILQLYSWFRNRPNLKLDRFTPYDFKQMNRRSYYPHNQQIVSTITATESTGALVASRPVTPAMNDHRSDKVMIRSNGNGDYSSQTPPLPEQPMTEKERFWFWCSVHLYVLCLNPAALFFLSWMSSPSPPSL